MMTASLFCYSWSIPPTRFLPTCCFHRDEFAPRSGAWLGRNINVPSQELGFEPGKYIWRRRWRSFWWLIALGLPPDITEWRRKMASSLLLFDSVYVSLWVCDSPAAIKHALSRGVLAEPKPRERERERKGSRAEDGEEKKHQKERPTTYEGWSRESPE